MRKSAQAAEAQKQKWLLGLAMNLDRKYTDTILDVHEDKVSR